jgi:hypothetical protein
MKATWGLGKVRALAVLAISAGTLGFTVVSGSGGTAQADPLTNNGSVTTTALVNVGADVTQDLFDAYAGASQPGTATTQFFTPLSAGASANNITIQSFDASPQGGTTTAPGSITTVVGGPTFDRPNSSTAGIQALQDSINFSTLGGFENSSGSATNTPVDVQGQISFARSARALKTTSGDGPTDLTGLPYARDGLGILYYDGAGDGAVKNLTYGDLKSLYTSSSGEITIPSTSDTLYGFITIAGSTPRSNLETVLGVTDAAANTAALATGTGDNNITQNSGNAFYAAVQTLEAAHPNSDVVIPISAGSWEGQANGEGFDRSNLARGAGVDLVDITNQAGTDIGKPYTGTAPGATPVAGSETPSTLYYQDLSDSTASDPTWGYDLYTIVPTADLGSFGGNAAIKSLFDGSTSVLCSSAAQTIAHEFGFDSLTGSEGTCGSTTNTGNS